MKWRNAIGLCHNRGVGLGKARNGLGLMGRKTSNAGSRMGSGAGGGRLEGGERFWAPNERSVSAE